MKSVHMSAAFLLVLAIACQPTSSEPGLAPLAAFKAGLVAGILKSLKIQPARSSSNGQSYQGTASGDVSFSGSLTRNGNPYHSNGYAQPYWGGGQLKLTGNVNYSGQRRPISSNGSGTRRHSIRGNVTFNGNVSPVHTTTNAPVVAYAISPVETYTTEPVTEDPTPTYVAAMGNGPSLSSSMSNGYNVAEVHAVRSNSGMPYGYGNVNINVANAGSGIGAVIHLNGDRTTESTSDTSAAVTAEPAAFDDFSSFSSTSDDTFLSSDTFSDLPVDTNLTLSEDTFGNYDSFDSVNSFDTTADNEILPQTDFGGTDFSDFSTNFEENTDSFVSTDFATESTTSAPNSVKIEFNASGSGSIKRGNGLRGSGNLAFDSSISSSSATEAPLPITDSFTSDSDTFGDYGTFAGNGSPSFNTDEGNFASDFNTDFTTDNGAGFTSDFNSDSNSGFNTELTSDSSTDLSSDFNTDFTSDFSTDVTSDFSTDTMSDYSTDFTDTSVRQTSETLSANNGFEIDTSGYASGTTNDDLEPSVAVSGTNTQLYDSYIQTNVDAIRALSDIVKTHGSGRPVTIRLRTAHRVRQPSQASSSLSSTAGGGLLGIFSDGSRYKVSQAPLLYKYSDVIESPDATPPRQYQISASASGSANLNLVGGRSIAGGRMRLERRPRTQGKSIPNQANLPNTIAENLQRARLQAARNNNNAVRTQNRSQPQQAPRIQANASNARIRQIMPQSTNGPNTKSSNRVRNPNISARLPINRAQGGVTSRNSNRNLDAKSIRDNRRTQSSANSANSNNEFSFLGVLAQFAEAHRLSLIKDAQKTSSNSAPDARSNPRQRNNQTHRFARHVSNRGSSGRAINSVSMQGRTEVPISSMHNTRHNYRGMLYESNPTATRVSSSRSVQIQNSQNLLNRPMLNQTPRYLPNRSPVIQNPNMRSNPLPAIVSAGRGNLGIPSVPPNSQKAAVSSLDRKENSGVTRAKLRYRHSEVIPSPRA